MTANIRAMTANIRGDKIIAGEIKKSTPKINFFSNRASGPARPSFMRLPEPNQ